MYPTRQLAKPRGTPSQATSRNHDHNSRRVNSLQGPIDLSHAATHRVLTRLILPPRIPRLIHAHMPTASWKATRRHVMKGGAYDAAVRRFQISLSLHERSPHWT